MFLKVGAAAAAVLAIYIAAERIAGPSVGPMPVVLPYIARDPPPAAMPAWDSGADPVNPDPEMRRLHAQGITGRHIGVAIIDSFLLTRHQEYQDRMRWYDEIDGGSGDAAGWHGTAVASLAVGRTVGVAPGADLYFIGLGVIWANQPIGNWFAAPRRAFHARSAPGPRDPPDSRVEPEVGTRTQDSGDFDVDRSGSARPERHGGGGCRGEARGDFRGHVGPRRGAVRPGSDSERLGAGALCDGRGFRQLGDRILGWTVCARVRAGSGSDPGTF